jgi:hypothetical protein
MVRDFFASLDFGYPCQFALQYYYTLPEGGDRPLATTVLWRSRPLVPDRLHLAHLRPHIYRYHRRNGSQQHLLTGKRLVGRWASVLAAVLFIASPLVQKLSAQVMTKHLATLGMLVSTLYFARFVRTERTGDGLAFGAVAAVAILTHGNARRSAWYPE